MTSNRTPRSFSTRQTSKPVFSWGSGSVTTGRSSLSKEVNLAEELGISLPQQKKKKAPITETTPMSPNITVDNAEFPGSLSFISTTAEKIQIAPRIKKLIPNTKDPMILSPKEWSKEHSENQESHVILKDNKCQ